MNWQRRFDAVARKDGNRVRLRSRPGKRAAVAQGTGRSPASR
jgi:hypothetical protein